jgi:hypothetical protein
MIPSCGAGTMAVRFARPGGGASEASDMALERDAAYLSGAQYS